MARIGGRITIQLRSRSTMPDARIISRSRWCWSSSGESLRGTWGEFESSPGRGEAVKRGCELVGASATRCLGNSPNRASTPSKMSTMKCLSIMLLQKTSSLPHKLRFAHQDIYSFRFRCKTHEPSDSKGHYIFNSILDLRGSNDDVV